MIFFKNREKKASYPNFKKPQYNPRQEQSKREEYKTYDRYKEYKHVNNVIRERLLKYNVTQHSSVIASL
jgi:hypothetical protein